MQNDTVIRVEKLGKRYRIGVDKKPSTNFQEKIQKTLSSPFQWLAKQMRSPTEEEILWALKDISFEIKRGEVVGIIGKNGAGKSTLLKVLSRITEPSEGFAEIKGRVGALLEVGTGMHPELTGRENTYQNGCILGMRKWEIDQKFDEIVSFSGIEKFIDTPVKFYSSGQRVRLGFAIAAHLEPEILVVDEVLAVGDAEFQKKCLGKMKDVAGHGRTVLFVSHNISAVLSLCDRGLYLESGKVKALGNIDEVASKYISSPRHEVPRKRNSIFELKTISVTDESDKECETFSTTQDLLINLTYELYDINDQLRIGFDLFYGVEMTPTFRSFDDNLIPTRTIGENSITAVIPKNLLRQGKYTISVIAAIHKEKWIYLNEVYKSFDLYNMDGIDSNFRGELIGPISPYINWSRETKK